MKIEFSFASTDGTNVEILLIECLDAGETPVEMVVDGFFTTQHQFQICARPDKPEYLSCEKFFAYLEETLPLPTIGGKYAAQHPYWTERAERKASHA